MAADIILYTEADLELRALFDRERNGDEKEAFERKLLAMPENVRWRDNYNRACRLWTLGLSYWRDMVPLLSEGMVLAPDDCRDFALQIASAMPPAHEKLDTLIGDQATEFEYVRTNFELDISPYTPEELAWCAFDAGRLAGLLYQGARSNGVLCSV